MSIDQLLSDRQRKRAVALILASPLVSQRRLDVAVSVRLEIGKSYVAVLASLAVAAAAAAECSRLSRSMLSNVARLKQHLRVSTAGRHSTLSELRRRSLLITLSTVAARTLFLIWQWPSPAAMPSYSANYNSVKAKPEVERRMRI